MKKSFGQHFLRDRQIIEQIIAAVGVVPGERIVEVGPGGGALTSELVHFPNPLVLIEADGDLIDGLKQRFSTAEVIHADAARTDFDEVSGGMPWVFVSNLPYNAGNAILEQVFQAKNAPRALVVMVQKEVGERMNATAGETSVLSVATQLYAVVEELFQVPPTAFTPPPKVDSVVLRLTPVVPHARAEEVIQLAKIGFLHRRKQLRQTLARAGVTSLGEIDSALERLGKNITARPQDLCTQDWVKLFEYFARTQK